MNSYNYNHYLVNQNGTGWITGTLADAIAIATLGLLDANVIEIVMYSLKESYSINCGNIIIKLRNNYL